MTLYVALFYPEHSGFAEFLGVYSTDERAMSRCEDFHKAMWDGVPVYHDTRWSWTADQPLTEWTGNPHASPGYYVVRLTELDEW